MPTNAGDRLYRVLLRAFPPDVRAVSGVEMVRQFRAEREARRGRPLALAALWARAIVDLAWHGALDRLSVPATVSLRGAAMTTSEPRSNVSRPFDGVLKDVAWGARRLRAAPGFALVAVITLALGIGATSAIFSVVDGVMLKPLGFPDPSRVVGLFQVWEGKRDVYSSPNFLDVQARAKSFTSAAAYSGDGVTLTGAGDPVGLANVDVSAGFFDVVATPPLLGRTLVRADNEPGHTDVIVIGNALWTSRFGADPSIVGRRITIDGRAREVVGVMPAGFVWPFGAESWTPAAYTPSFTTSNRGAWYFHAMARLKPGVTIADASAEMADLGRQLEQAYPQLNAKVGMTAYPMLDDMLGDTKRSLLVLLGAVGFVLLIACVNVANLVLARAAARESELAVRVAMGAGRWRLVRQALVESLLLALAGGAAGLALAIGGLRLLRAVALPGVPRLDTAGLDGTMVAFTFAVTALAGVVFGLVPALQSSGRTIVDSLRERGRSALASRRGRRTRTMLVVTEMALAVLLLTGAGLLIHSFVRLTHVDPGFRVDHGLVFRVGLPEAQYADDGQRNAFFSRASEALKAAPGVADVGMVLFVPPTPQAFDLDFEVAGRPPAAPGSVPTMEIRIADPTYFRLMGIALRRGRSFTATDRAGTAPVMLLTESAVRRYFADEDPLGRHIAIGWRRNQHRVEGDVIGVVADVKSFGVDHDAPAQLYLPLAQTPENSMAFVVRTAVEPESMFGTVRATMHTVDPNLPIAKIETLAAHVDASVAERRFYMWLLGVFAASALALAAVGIFGVMSFLVAQRTREIGIRVALGAARGSVVGMVMRQTFILAAAGAVTGTAAGLGLSGLMQTMLFDVKPTDPLTFAVVDAALILVAALASWVPVRRALRVDPTLALRAE